METVRVHREKTGPVRPTGRSLARALLRVARPRQWSKNLLVAAAPAAAGVLAAPAIAGRTLVAFLVFCMAASGTYYLNDALDAAADRNHPLKRHRPVAAGLVSVRTASTIAVVLLVGALASSLALAQPAFTGVVALYVGLTVAYSVRLKHVAVVDVLIVAGGFIIRAVAGGLATGLPLTEWFLIVTSFGALFVVSGKRHAETASLGDARATHRLTLDAYSPQFTQHLLTISSGITIIAYCLWAFGEQAVQPGGAWFTLSILPFVGVMLRYAMLVFAGHGGEPEDIFLRDRPLQAVAVAWAALVALGIYAG